MNKLRKIFTSIIELIDTFFDKHPLTGFRYFVVGFMLNAGLILYGWFHSFNNAGFNIADIIYAFLLVWLIWLGPKYLQHLSRQLVAALGIGAFFLPILISATVAWLGQPGWPLQNVVRDRFTDFNSVIGMVVIPIILYLVLLMRFKMYNRVTVKRHTKKDLFQ